MFNIQKSKWIDISHYLWYLSFLKEKKKTWPFLVRQPFHQLSITKPEFNRDATRGQISAR